MDTEVPVGAVLVGLDGSAESARALSWAATEAQRRQWPLHLIHVVDDLPWGRLPGEQETPRQRPVVRNALEMLHDWDPTLMVSWSEPEGDPAARLAKAADAARLAVVGSKARGAVGETVFGSVTTQLIARTRCPVAVLRAGTPIPRLDAPVVAGIAYDRDDEAVLDAALEQAAGRGVDLVVIHAWQLDASTVVDHIQLQGRPEWEAQQHEDALLSRTVAAASHRYPAVAVTTHATHAGAATTLERHCADAGLLVVGARGRNEIGGAVLGSVSQQVIRAANCPVLVARSGRTTAAALDTEATARASS